MVETQLFQIIRHYVNHEPVTCELDWPQVWLLAKKHSLTQFVSLYMNELPAEQRPEGKLRKDISAGFALLLTRQVNQEIAINDIHSVLEAKACFHLFMKGSVTKQRFQDSIYRSMGDIDFLYKESQHEIVKAALLANDFSDYQEGRKNDTYFRKPYVCVEAHRQLVPSDSSFFSYYTGVWDRAIRMEGSRYCYEMRVEDELVFNIVHLAIHFLEGGAGIRFILDVYVYNHLDLDSDYVEQELMKLDLLDFYRNVSGLAEYWFGNGRQTEVSEKLSTFILGNGTFGSSENSSALAVREGRWRYLRRMCFPSYEEMISIFPWLKGKRALLPTAWILRGFRVLTRKKGKLKAQIRKTRQGDKSRGRDLHQFYQECGLRSKL